MSPHSSRLLRVLFSTAVMAVLAAPALAQRVAPAPPATYDAEIRYSIRAGTQQRIAQFREMIAYLESIGFQPAASEDLHEQAADPNAERLRGTLPSGKVADVFREPHVRTILLMPAGMKLPANPEQRVLVQLRLEPRLSPRLERDLSNQLRPHLAAIGFVEKVGYDHEGNTRILGTIPSSEVGTLVSDLRDVPSGWLAPETPRDKLPEPIRYVNPVQIAEVIAEPAGVPPSADVPQPTAADSTLEKLPVDLRDANPADVLRMEAILAYPPRYGDRSWRGLFALPGVTIEGRLGPVVSFRGPAGAAKDLVTTVEISTVRRAVQATHQPPVAPPGNAVNAWGLTGLGRLHSLGGRGKGVRMAVIDSDFRGAAQQIGSGLPKSTAIVDLTAARTYDIIPDPMPAGSDVGSGTQAALAVRLAAPDSEIVLVRIDRAAAYMLADVAQAMAGNWIRSENFAARNRELLADNDQLRIQRRRITTEQEALASNFNQDEETIQRRKQLAQDLANLAGQERRYLERLTRFTKLEEHLINLGRAQVVVNTLIWDIGYPVNSTGTLSQFLDSSLLGPPNAGRQRGPVYWFQPAGDTRQQAWSGLLRDVDGNGVFEFAPPEMPLPVDRWTREVNFLGWSPTSGERSLDLPASAKLRVAVQWTEPHDPQAAAVGTDPYRTPIADIHLLILRQRDPTGTKVATDDFNVVARSTKMPELIMRTPELATYEAIVEFTVESAGRYALRLEGVIPPTIRPRETPTVATQVRQWEPRARVFVESIGQTSGRPAIIDYPSQMSGLGMPDDALSTITVGAANSRGEPQPYSASGPLAGRALLAKPTLMAFDELALPGGVKSGGTNCSAGFAGGMAASMLSVGVPISHDLNWLGIPPGGLLVVPPAWLEQLERRTPSPRP